MRVKRSKLSQPEKEPESDSEDDTNIVSIKDCVYFSSGVETNTILKLIEHISKATDYALEHCYDIKETYVYLYINSPGGDAFAGMSAMDHIRINRVPIITIADGFVASAATFLLLGGFYRKALKNSRILIHQLSTGFWGKFVDLLDEVENSKELMSTFHKLYMDNTYMKEEQVRKLLKGEIHMVAQDALKMGIVDEIW